jgi:3-methyladenine DNA glycosylase AlkD
MEPENLVSTIQKYCKTHANPENVRKYSRYFKSGFNAWGLNQTQMNELTLEILKTQNINLKTVVDAMPLLMKSGKYEETSFGLLLINGMKKQFTHELKNIISAWFGIGISNWAHADTLGMWILPSLIESGHCTEQDFQAWIISDFSFQRRCVPVTFIKSLKNTSSPGTLFRIIEPLMKDDVREVQQGTGWFLREAWKKFPQETEQFLRQWKNSSPRLIFQYACEKMDKEYRQQFRKEKN